MFMATWQANVNKFVSVVILSSKMLNEILVVVAAACIAYWLSRRKYDYWRKKQIKYMPPTLLLGNYGDYILQKKNLGEVTQDICRKMPDEPIVGAFYGTEPVAVVQDPEYLKLIMTKDFYYFNTREVNDYTNREVITRHMFFTGGDNWKVQRQNTSLLFTSSKMRNMFTLVKNCATTYESMLDEEFQMSDIIEARLVVAKFTIDSICSCAFGIDAGVMTSKNEKNMFRKAADSVFETSRIRTLFMALRAIWPSIFYGLGFKVFPKGLYKFFSETLYNVQKSRDFKPSSRNDFVDYLLVLKQHKYLTGAGIRSMKDSSVDTKVSVELDDDLFVALCLMFFSGGFETSATTTTFTLYELAKHPEIQDKVLDEIDAYLASKNNVLDYDCITQMPYVEQCVYESMRMYPALPILTREVYEDYTFPNGLKLERGMRVHIPVYHMHRHPDYFPDPDEFVPDRHSTEGKKSIRSHTFFPFGEGPRLCLGLRFAKMQVMAGLVTLLKKYRVELAPGMPTKITYIPTSVVTQSNVGVNLRLVPRKGWEDRVFNH